MEKLRIAVVGAGNIGRAAIDAIIASPDMELAGVVRRRADPLGDSIRVVTDIGQLGPVDAAILAVPSREVPEAAEKLLLLGVNTVDSYDIHADIPALRSRFDKAAKAGGAVSMLSAGWDPGTDSMMRAMMEAMAPRGLTTTDFGPGMSMGHTVAVKAIPGVADAFSLTLPMGDGFHRRIVYVRLEHGAVFAEVEAAIKADDYFRRDETHVRQVEDVQAILDMGHGAMVSRKGASGSADNQLLRFEMRINNPALTAQVMVCSARAALRQKPGCYTLIEIPPVDLLPGGRDGWVAKLV